MFKMTQCTDSYLRFGWNLQLFFLFYIPLLISAFSPQSTKFASVRRQTVHDFSHQSLSALSGTTTKSDDPCTIQILMSDTGGGHRASANALRDALEVLYPGKFECDIVDIYTDYGPFWPFNGVVAGYKLMAKYSILWDFFYHSGETEFGLWLNELLLDVFCHEPFKKCLARPSGSTDKRADMVVSVHPLCQNPTLKILADLDTNGETRDRMKRETPFVTVVTDLGGASKTWFNPFVDKCFVPSTVLNEKAKSMGLSATQIVQYGLPIRKGFWSSSSNSSSPKEKKKPLFDFIRGNNSPPTGKSNVRSELGLDGDLPTVLVVGGGDGMGGIVDIANAMGEKLGSNTPTPSCQMVVVCGSNKDAKDKLSSKSWGPGVRVVVQGFVNNMDEWMNASDAIVTKAGPGTIAEASICGLPCMLFAYLPGQEEGNVPFVEESGFGKYSSNPQVIANTVNSWLSSPETLQSLSAAALKAARPDATLDIARDIADIAFATKTKNEKVLVRSR